MTTTRDVGRTADGAYQVGVRRTLPHPEQAVWHVLLSPEGTRAWLGGPVEVVEGRSFQLLNGASATVTVYRPGSHLRIRWQPPDRDAPTILQIRVIPAKTGTTLAIHQERLRDAAERSAMRGHWERVVDDLTALLPT